MFRNLQMLLSNENLFILCHISKSSGSLIALLRSVVIMMLIFIRFFHFSRTLAHLDQFSVSDAIDRNRYEIEAHFLCNITPKQLWEMYKMLEKDDLLQDQ